MAYAALADTIGATWFSWTSAAKARDGAAMRSAADHLVWLAGEAVKLLEKRAFESYCSPGLHPRGRAVLRRSGWR